MSFAIIETGGKQYKVSPSKILEVEKNSSDADLKKAYRKLAKAQKLAALILMELL